MGMETTLREKGLLYKGREGLPAIPRRRWGDHQKPLKTQLKEGTIRKETYFYVKNEAPKGYAHFRKKRTGCRDEREGGTQDFFEKKDHVLRRSRGGKQENKTRGNVREQLQLSFGEPRHRQRKTRSKQQDVGLRGKTRRSICGGAACGRVDRNEEDAGLQEKEA